MGLVGDGDLMKGNKCRGMEERGEEIAALFIWGLCFLC